ncbi:MAG: segregation and condensation protein A [Bacilli bacterium]
MDYSVKIDEFEGPLDLLLHLIKQSNINIQDIEINEITKQYLDYLNKMEELNINVASSYIVMAAELMEIKSKSLLPVQEENNEEDEEVVSKENLINRLIEYQKYKDMISKFKELESDRRNIYVKSPEKVSNYIDNKIVNDNDTTVDDLVNAFKNFLDRVDKEKPITTKITNKEYSVKARKQNIKKILKEKSKVLFTELFTENNKPFIVVTFLSILEMTKENEIILRQDTNFKDITIELKVKS